MAIPAQNSEDEPSAFRRFFLPAVFVIALFATLLWRDSSPENLVFSGETMGTTYTVKVVDVDQVKREHVQQAVEDALNSVNNRMSTYLKDSELMRFNSAPAHEPFSASDALIDVMTAAKIVGQRSDGAFDVTVGPIVNAYGFGPDRGSTPPGDARLAELMKSVGLELVTINPKTKTLTKMHDNVFVDLSSIAKGYGVDRAAEAIEAIGLTNYMVEVGGEVRAHGVNESGEAWRLGIETPDSDKRQIQRVVRLSEGALATSGDYRNYYEHKGVRISHTIDARTGRPIKHRLASVTVIHSNCMMADAWATAIDVLGEEQGLALAEAQALAVLLIVRDDDGFREVESAAFRALQN